MLEYPIVAALYNAIGTRMNALTQSQARYDVVIVGAGIVGLTVAYELLQRDAALNIAILDKEPSLGKHASGRNSGVLHCGIYYGADTMKARVCATGAERMKQFAREHGIACKQNGKVILATDESQLPTLERLLKNARDNRIAAERIDRAQLRELEPYAAEGEAIYCPTTAVIDNKAVLQKLRVLLEQAGVTFLLGWQAIGQRDDRLLRTNRGELAYGYLFNCAGAYADRVAALFGLAHDYALVPFKGIYWKLSPDANPRVRSNIYPVPDIKLPFLGVHLTRGIDGEVYLGPTAIPALGRENYGILTGIKAREAWQVARQLLSMYLANQQHFRLLAHTELKKYLPRYFFNAAQKLMPSLTRAEMVRSSKAGIRPQLVNLKKRALEMDFIFEQTDSSLHVLNAISPAFTSSFAFAEAIVDQSPFRQNPAQNKSA